MARSTPRKPPLFALINSDKIRHLEQDGQTLYAVTDVLATLVDTDQSPNQLWGSLRKRLPQLDTLVETAEFPAPDGTPTPADAAPLAGILRIIQSLATPKAERIKTWLAHSAVERLREIEDPELAIHYARQEYERRGYKRQWIDQRMRSISSRHELTSEWYKRGAKESEHFRALTNELMQTSFGMDVEQYRAFKSLTGNDNLRDHMTDLELVLTSLGETTAAVLHRTHEANGFEHLQADAHQAGEIVAHARAELEQAIGRPVVDPGSPAGITRPRRSRGGRTLRDQTPEATEPQASPAPEPHAESKPPSETPTE